MKRTLPNSTLSYPTHPMKRTPIKKRKRRGGVREKRRNRAVKEASTKQAMDKAAHVRRQGCMIGRAMGDPMVAGCAGITHAHHDKTRGAGGTSRHLVGLCAVHHMKLHDLGRLTFSRLYGVDLGAEAERLNREWQEMQS